MFLLKVEEALHESYAAHIARGLIVKADRIEDEHPRPPLVIAHATRPEAAVFFLVLKPVIEPVQALPISAGSFRT